MIVGGFNIYQHHTFTSYQQLCSVRSLKKSPDWMSTSNILSACLGPMILPPPPLGGVVGAPLSFVFFNTSSACRHLPEGRFARSCVSGPPLREDRGPDCMTGSASHKDGC